VYITFFHNCFIHANNSLQHELPILTNSPNTKRQVHTKMTSIENQVKALTKQFKPLAH